jgi:micrococcal nuclease
MLLLLTLACCAPEPITAQCTVTDGDTIRCGDERIRLLGIDAPEIGECRQGRQCAPGDPYASKAMLADKIADQSLTIRRVGQDRYGRTLGVVYAGGENLSCAQLSSGNAIYRRDWDNGGAVRADCPGVAR